MNAPYLLLPIGVLTLFVYLLSYFLVQQGIIAKTLHRKAWNSVLLITFLVAAILGLILTVEINYKLEIPYIRTILIWHVDFGIAMSVVGIIHFLWHRNYYFKLFKSEKIVEQKSSVSFHDDVIQGWKLFAIILVLGLSSIVTQVILLRELINIFSGNELITGIVLASWMALTGLGALLGKSIPNQVTNKKIIQNLTWLGILPVLLVVIIYVLKSYLFPPGVLIDIRLAFPVTLILLSPYCLLSGNLFKLLANYIKESQNIKPDSDQLYAFETVGGVLGGLIVSFVMIFWLSGIQSLLVIALMLLMLSIFVQKQKRGWIFAVMILFVLPLETWLKKMTFPNQKILITQETPYGNVVVSQAANQVNFFENHEFLYSTQNVIENEETVHYGMLQCNNPRRVLLVSGDPKGLMHEILKYKSVTQLDYVEENKWLLRTIADLDTIPAVPEITMHTEDIRKFLRNKDSRYDAVLLAVPEPSTLQANRFYTVEFFRLLKQHLNGNGVISFGLPSSGDYMGSNNIKVLSILVNTIKLVFANVLIIPGEKDFVLASDHSLSVGIAALTQSKGLENSYVNPYYIDDFSLAEKIKLMEHSISAKEKVNHDFTPSAVYYSTHHYINKFSGKTLLITLLPMLFLLLPVFWLKKQSVAIYTSGFIIATLEVVLLLAFQIVFGYVYAASGVIISACMAGLATGVLSGRKWKYSINTNLLTINQIFIGTFSILFIWLISRVNASWNNSVLYLIFFIAVMIPSILAGFQFSFLLRHVQKDKTISVSHLYATDLFGAAMGAATVSLLILPLAGIAGIVGLILGISLIAILFLLAS